MRERVGPGVTSYPRRELGVTSYPRRKPGVTSYPRRKPGVTSYPRRKLGVTSYPRKEETRWYLVKVWLGNLGQKPCPGEKCDWWEIWFVYSKIHQRVTKLHSVKHVFCIFCHRWPKLPQRLPLVPMMVEAEPMGADRRHFFAFLKPQNFGRKWVLQSPQNQSSGMNSSSWIARTP